MSTRTENMHVLRLDGFWQRLLGLIGRPALSARQAVLLPGCSAVHTAFMRYTIDVVFVGDDGRVLRVVRNLRPWRVVGCPGASHVLETLAGCAPTDDVVQAVVRQALGVPYRPRRKARRQFDDG